MVILNTSVGDVKIECVEPKGGTNVVALSILPKRRMELEDKIYEDYFAADILPTEFKNTRKLGDYHCGETEEGEMYLVHDDFPITPGFDNIVYSKGQYVAKRGQDQFTINFPQ